MFTDKRTVIFCICGLVLVFASGWLVKPTTESEQQTSHSLRIATSWVANPQFAGFFLAQELGYYQQYGLDVEFLPYQTQVSVHQLLVSKQADLGVDTPDQVILARGQGDPLLALAAIFRTSPLAFASHASLGVQRPSDLKGLRIGLLPDGSSTVMDAMLLQNGIPLQAVERAPMRYDMQDFLEGRLDVIPVYLTNEPFLLDQKGIEYNLLLPHNHGMDTYGDTLIAKEPFVEQNEQQVADFVKATMQGWRFLAKRPEQARKLLAGYMHPLYSQPEHQAFLIQQSAPFIYSGLGPLGWMETSHWQRLYTALERQGLVKEPIDVRRVFTNQFLDMAH